MITQQEIKLIRKSWAHFRRVNPEIVADAFYAKLFLDNPSLRKMFPADMKGQYEKLMNMLTTIVSRLDKFDEIVADVEAMGTRHKGYGVKPRHYKMVGDALIWTLKSGLAHDWDDDTAAAWIKCYNFLAEKMMDAASSTLK